MSVVRVADGITFRFHYRQHERIEIIRPLILDIESRIDTTGCLYQAFLDAAGAFPGALDFFLIDPQTRTFSFKPEFLFDQWHVVSLMVAEKGELSEIQLDDIDGGLRTLQSIFSLCAAGIHERTYIREQLAEGQRAVFDRLVDEGVFVEATDEPRALVPPDVDSGVYRLQHASLLYRSKTTGILVDPHLHSVFSELESDITRRDLEGRVDAILISHFHEDHWSLSTLMMFPKDTPIVVPKVPRPSVICADMEGLLRECGFVNVFSVDWYSEPLKFGDIEVHVLPFYGEQPLRFEQSFEPSLQNWGNTYVVRTETYTSWFVVDSGNDARGSMADVARYVRDHIGPVDTILSNLRTFNVVGPLWVNGGLNWLTLSFDQMVRLPSMVGDLLTLTPIGVAELCAIIDARFYLPYAHWWGELGATPGQPDDDESEPALMEALAAELQRLATGTGIIPWGIGDGVLCMSENVFSLVRLATQSSEHCHQFRPSMGMVGGLRAIEE